MMENGNPSLVSVVMPCFKMGRFVGEALDSIGKQTYENWEVIAVDDCGPEDGTRQAVEEFAASYPNHRVKYLRHEINRGVSGARNTAIREARGAWLAFLDPDDVWFPEKLALQMATLIVSPEILGCFAFGKIERLGDGLGYAVGYSLMGHVDHGLPKCDSLAIASGRVMFPFSSVLVRREAFNSIGGFQTDLPFQNEDRLLLACIASLGTFTWQEIPLCIYRIHDGSATMSVMKSDAALMVEFDLCARISIWMRVDRLKRPYGRAVMIGPCRKRLIELLAGTSWLQWRGIVVDLCARLVLAYPGQLPFFAFHLARQTPLFAFLRRSLRLAIDPECPTGGRSPASRD